MASGAPPTVELAFEPALLALRAGGRVLHLGSGVQGRNGAHGGGTQGGGGALTTGGAALLCGCGLAGLATALYAHAEAAAQQRRMAALASPDVGGGGGGSGGGGSGDITSPLGGAACDDAEVAAVLPADALLHALCGPACMCEHVSWKARRSCPASAHPIA